MQKLQCHRIQDSKKLNPACESCAIIITRENSNNIGLVTSSLLEKQNINQNRIRALIKS